MLLKTPYLLFIGDAPDPLSAKVAQGIRDWRPDYSVGQFRQEGCKADLKIADVGIDEAVAKGAKTLVVGVANRGGYLSEGWLSVFEDAMRAGMDIASGLHNQLSDEPRLVKLADELGRSLIDVRIPQHEYPIASGVRRTGKRCLAVGTDCSVGKMYTALALEKALTEQGRASSFRATGQTGILITGNGVPLDAVIADFMAGSVEWLTPDNDAEHWDLIEGQGSLFHASYSGVTLALIHGGAPDALILCHEPTRKHMRGLPDYKLPSLKQLESMALDLAHVVNPACKVVGVSVNTSALDESAAKSLLAGIEDEMGMPAVDPFRDGAHRLADALV